MARKPEPEIKPTRATRRVLLVLLTGSPRLRGFTIGSIAGVGSGKAYAILARLERLGWADSEWGSPNPQGNRPRYYRLTRQGRAKAIGLLGLEMPDD